MAYHGVTEVSPSGAPSGSTEPLGQWPARAFFAAEGWAAMAPVGSRKNLQYGRPVSSGGSDMNLRKGLWTLLKLHSGKRLHHYGLNHHDFDGKTHYFCESLLEGVDIWNNLLWVLLFGAVQGLQKELRQFQCPKPSENATHVHFEAWIKCLCFQSCNEYILTWHREIDEPEWYIMQAETITHWCSASMFFNQSAREEYLWNNYSYHEGSIHIYPLVTTHIAIEHGHWHSFPWQMVIFHSDVNVYQWVHPINIPFNHYTIPLKSHRNSELTRGYIP